MSADQNPLKKPHMKRRIQNCRSPGDRSYQIRTLPDVPNASTGLATSGTNQTKAEIRDLVLNLPTSHVEKQNHTLRMHCRRLTRLTNAFSKKFENFHAAVSPNFAYYNFCKRHISVKSTPAQAAGIENHQWTVAELLEHCGE